MSNKGLRRKENCRSKYFFRHHETIVVLGNSWKKKTDCLILDKLENKTQDSDFFVCRETTFPNC